MFDLSFSHLIVATLLVSYHLYVHDLTLLAIPLVTLLNHGASNGRDAPMVRNAILVALIVLSLLIVSLLLSHRLRSWTAIGLSLLAVVLSHECVKLELNTGNVRIFLRIIHNDYRHHMANALSCGLISLMNLSA